MFELIATGFMLALLIALALWQAKKNAEHWRSQLATIMGREQEAYLPTVSFRINRTAQGTTVEEIAVSVTAESSQIATNTLNQLIDRAEQMSNINNQQNPEVKRWTG